MEEGVGRKVRRGVQVDTAGVPETRMMRKGTIMPIYRQRAIPTPLAVRELARCLGLKRNLVNHTVQIMMS